MAYISVYGLTQTVAPTAEPVTLDELKTHMRVAHSIDDDDIAGYGRAAREYVELTAAQQLVTATFRVTLDEFPYGNQDKWNPPQRRGGIIRLPKPPLQQVLDLYYVDTNGVTQLLDPSQYQVSKARMPGRLAPARFLVWPIADPQTMDAIWIDFVAGYGDPTQVPQRAKDAIKRLATHLYDNRELATETALKRIPVGLQTEISSLWHGEYV